MASFFFRTGSSIVRYCPHPVGTYLHCTFDPNAEWVGTTWVKQVQGSYLVSAGSTYVSGGSYGSNTHTLTVEEMPRHTHYPPVATVWGGDAAEERSIATTDSPVWTTGDEHCAVTFTGNGAAHNNMPCSVAVPLWRRDE